MSSRRLKKKKADGEDEKKDEEEEEWSNERKTKESDYKTELSAKVMTNFFPLFQKMALIISNR